MPVPRLLFLAAGVVLIVWLLWWLPKRQVLAARKRLKTTEPPLAENEFRKTLAQIIGGLIILVGLLTTFDQLQIAQQELIENSARSVRQLELAEAGQVTERFARAIEQLSSDRISLRVGGIYSLERIGKDSARDRAAVVRVLNTFVRENVYALPNSKPPPAPEQRYLEAGFRFPSPALRADVDASLHVIKDLISNSHDAELPPLNLQLLDLSYSDTLRKANLRGANLYGVHLCKSDLRGAMLDGANLGHSGLAQANLEGASLKGADLTSANLIGAVLKNAVLGGATARYARLDADLTGVDLTLVKDLETAYLENACSDGGTTLPDGFSALDDCFYFYHSGMEHPVECQNEWPALNLLSGGGDWRATFSPDE
jgi:hypothetical protein